MDGIQKRYREKKNFYIGYNMIFDLPLPISEHAVVVYCYLCRCADGEGQAFPSFKKIGEKCRISDRTAQKAVNQLESVGLLTRLQRFTKKGGKTSNLYTVWDSPNADYLTLSDNAPCEGDSHTHANHVPIPCEGDSHTHANHVPIPCEPRSYKVIPNEVISNEVIPSEGEKDTPAPEYKIYGIHKCVHLTVAEYDGLVGEFGGAKTVDYIDQLDGALKSGKEKYKIGTHYAVIRRWIKRDERTRAADQQPAKPKKNAFVNFKQRKIDYAEMERKEREQLQADIKNGSADASTSRQTTKTITHSTQI